MANDKMERSSRLHETWDFCANTTAHGLGRVADANSWSARVFWLAIFVAAFILSTHQIYWSFLYYLEYPTKTTVSLEKEEKLSLPGVTVCNISPIKRSKLVNTSLWHNITKAAEEDGEFDGTQLKDKLISILLSKYGENAWKAGHQGDELITNCHLPDTKQPCSHKNFSRWFDMDYGNCYTMNTHDLFVQHSGHRKGVKLTLFIDADEYLGHMADSVGALVSLQSPFTQSNQIDGDPIFVAPGSAVSVSVNAHSEVQLLEWPSKIEGQQAEDGRQYITRMDYPYNNKKHCNSNLNYNQMTCLKECIAKKMRKDCGCVSLTLHQTPTCDAFNATQAACVSKSRQGIHYDKCSCDQSCREMHFLQTVSSAAWPSKTHMPMLLKLLNKTGASRAAEVVKDLESARNNMVLVNIHYASMTVKNIKQTPAITWGTLLGDIGGQLGLFIGVSCITLVEFLGLLWGLIRPTKKTSNTVQEMNPTRD